MTILDTPIAVLDFETTGFPPGARAVEVAVVHLDHGEITGRWSTLIDPQSPIPPRVAAIHGITDEAVRGAPPFAIVLGELAEWLEGRAIAAYNAPFDQAILRAELDRLPARTPHDRFVSTPWIDPLVWVRKLEPSGRATLSAVAERLGVRLDGAHRAEADAVATALVLAKIAPSLPGTMRELAHAQGRLCGKQKRDFDAWAASAGIGMATVPVKATAEGTLDQIVYRGSMAPLGR